MAASQATRAGGGTSLNAYELTHQARRRGHGAFSVRHGVALTWIAMPTLES